MKFSSFFLLLVACLTSSLLSAQGLFTRDSEIDSCKGKVWVSGDALALNDNLLSGFGYFLTENLLIGSRIESTESFSEYTQLELSPFIRYYIGSKDAAWQPYAQIEASWRFSNGLSRTFSNYGALVGMEKKLQGNTLLNIDLGYKSYRAFDGSFWEFNGRLNTLLGGMAGKNAAMSQFQQGGFLLDNRLFTLGISDSKILAGSFAGISPSGYYFLSDRLLLKGSLLVGMADYTTATSAIPAREVKQFGFNASTGLRYYLTKQSLFNIFSEAAIAYDYQGSNTNGNKNNLSETIATVELGNSLFINRSTTFDLGLQAGKSLGNSADQFGVNVLGRLNFWFR